MTEATQARDIDTALFSVADRVVEGERVRLRIGEREVAVISVEDLEFLEDIETKLDLLDALKALQEAVKDKRVVPWEDLLRDLKRERQLNGL